MGRPKALLPWGGHSLVEHVVAGLVPCVDEVLVVTSRSLVLPRGVEGLGARIIVDSEPERGPLAALRDGLAAARAGLVFVTATDAPFLTRDHVDALFERAASKRADPKGDRASARGDARQGVCAVVPRAGGHLQVLSAVYPRSAWREAEALLREGDASPLALLERIGFEPIEADDVAHPAPWHAFNTTREYAAALALAQARGFVPRPPDP